ncbi:unnamed protein product, partial [marine sediment metagenome]
EQAEAIDRLEFGISLQGRGAKPPSLKGIIYTHSKTREGG